MNNEAENERLDVWRSTRINHNVKNDEFYKYFSDIRIPNNFINDSYYDEFLAQLDKHIIKVEILNENLMSSIGRQKRQALYPQHYFDENNGGNIVGRYVSHEAVN